MSASNRAAALWEDRWVRFRMALKKHGVEPKHQDYYRSWVLLWIKAIKPRKFEEGNLDDVEGFLSQLGAAGKKGWQVHQAEEALQIMFQEVEPRTWARHWPEGLVKLASGDLASGEAADLGRRPMGDAGRFKGRTDSGVCPPKYLGFLEQVEEALRVERYSYRTERSYKALYSLCQSRFPA